MEDSLINASALTRAIIFNTKCYIEYINNNLFIMNKVLERRNTENHELQIRKIHERYIVSMWPKNVSSPTRIRSHHFLTLKDARDFMLSF
jgi:hypothetical protein